MNDRPTPPARDEFALLHPLRVRWGEVDMQGIVFNAHYFAYFDVGTSEYMRAIGYGYPEGLRQHGTDIFAVNASANFSASALYDDVLDLAVRVAHIGRTSLRYRLGVYRGETLLVDGGLTYVNGQIATKRPTPWPEDFKERILAFEKTAPTQA